MNWVRGDSLGTGSFATVNIAVPTNASTLLPSLMAAKSSHAHTSCMLKHEKQLLDRLASSPYIINCFGHDHTVENGEEFYNIFLEYAAGGSLADQVKIHGGRLPEPYVRRCTRTIVEGLNHIHASGIVHGDLKLENILVFDNGDVKIADFGLGKEKGEKQRKLECRGTPLFMSPELVNENECESPADIWALGCAVVEMITGKPAWEVDGSNMWSLLIRIGVGEELPKIPEELSEEGKDFLLKCLVKEAEKRWSAEMLLNHPFIKADADTFWFDKVNERLLLPSPRTHFDFLHRASTVTVSAPSSPDSEDWHMRELGSSCSAESRVQRLLTNERPEEWSESEGWTRVR
ncbi:hypothetical protein VNO78_08167 [Psophocarpus tetragonolobus]|uniref:Protein kinase domain-containing protein n=1 Tax=Psophocarpus tetragonolobus TaxID=3891 RepID=A0AAN9XSL7_PSOTE